MKQVTATIMASGFCYLKAVAQSILFAVQGSFNTPSSSRGNKKIDFVSNFDSIQKIK
jgi:hypothetical protein